MLLNSHKAGREYCHLLKDFLGHLKQKYSWQQIVWLEQSLTSMSSFTCSCWSLSSPKASMIKPEERCDALLEEHEKKTKTCVVFKLNADNEKVVSRTLNDGQQDDDDKEEEGDVEQDAVELVWISSWVL